MVNLKINGRDVSVKEGTTILDAAKSIGETIPTLCYLKDINEMFYDTGIGKEGYSIIGQGQIDRILSGKPEERRELFDEAAGIVKFKKEYHDQKTGGRTPEPGQSDRYPLGAYQTAGTTGETVRDSKSLSFQKRDA